MFVKQMDAKALGLIAGEAIVAFARSPEYWLPVGARLFKPKGALAFNEGESMIRKDWVGR